MGRGDHACSPRRVSGRCRRPATSARSSSAHRPPCARRGSRRGRERAGTARSCRGEKPLPPHVMRIEPTTSTPSSGVDDPAGVVLGVDEAPALVVGDDPVPAQLLDVDVVAEAVDGLPLVCGLRSDLDAQLSVDRTRPSPEPPASASWANGTKGRLAEVWGSGRPPQSPPQAGVAILGARSGRRWSVLQVRVCGGVEVEADGRCCPTRSSGGRQGRLVLAYLVCERHRAVRREELAELLWAEQLPESWSASLSAVVSRLRRLLTEAGLDGADGARRRRPAPTSCVLPADATRRPRGARRRRSPRPRRPPTPATSTRRAASRSRPPRRSRRAASSPTTASGSTSSATRSATSACGPRSPVGAPTSRAGAAGASVEAARDALALDGHGGGVPPAHAGARGGRRAGRGAAGLGALPDHARRGARRRPVTRDRGRVPRGARRERRPAAAPTTAALPSGVVTFLLTDIVESSALWEERPDRDGGRARAPRRDRRRGRRRARRHAAEVEARGRRHRVGVRTRDGRRGRRARAPRRARRASRGPRAPRPRLRMAMHTGEAFERGGDYFGPALNRAARLRSLAGAGEVLLSQAVAELVRDHLPDGVGAARPRPPRPARACRAARTSTSSRAHGAGRRRGDARPSAPTSSLVPPRSRPRSPAPVRSSAAATSSRSSTRSVGARGRGRAAARCSSAASRVSGKSRLAAEIAARGPRRGRARALRALRRGPRRAAAAVHRGGAHARRRRSAPTRLRAVRGVDELRSGRARAGRAARRPAPAVARRSRHRAARAVRRRHAARWPRRRDEAPVLLVLDDLHWAGKTTLSLLRHLLRGAEGARLLVVGTYRDTELARTHPLAATLADLRRDADTPIASRSAGSPPTTSTAYLAADRQRRPRPRSRARRGHIGQPVLPHRGAAPRRGDGRRVGARARCPRVCARPPAGGCRACPTRANDALSVAAVVGHERSTSRSSSRCAAAELIDEIAEACRAGLVVEEPGALGRFRFAHALVRQVLLAELVTAEAGAAAPHDRRAARGRAAGGRPRRPPRRPRVPLVRVRVGRAARTRRSTRAGGPPTGPWSASPTRRPATSTAWRSQALERRRRRRRGRGPTLHLARCDALLTAGDVAGARGAIDALELAAARIGAARRLVHDLRRPARGAGRARPARPRSCSRSAPPPAPCAPSATCSGEAKAHYVHALGARAARADRRGRARARRRARRRAQRRRPPPRRRDPRRGAARRPLGPEPGHPGQRPLPRRRPRAAHHRRRAGGRSRSRSAARPCSRRCAGACDAARRMIALGPPHGRAARPRPTGGSRPRSPPASSSCSTARPRRPRRISAPPTRSCATAGSTARPRRRRRSSAGRC